MWPLIKGLRRKTPTNKHASEASPSFNFPIGGSHFGEHAVVGSERKLS
jgi:hypothetical protein